MRFWRSFVGALTVMFVFALAQLAAAQETDPYVSCVRCHALPMQQARASLQGHGTGSLPAPEQACADCHDMWDHEQNPDLPPYQPYFLFMAGSVPGSPLSSVCLSCHTLPAGNHPYDRFPYFDMTPLPFPPLPPTSVLPLFTATGQLNQNPGIGGIVCSTCHDPHDPSYTVMGVAKFLRIGLPLDPSPTTTLCGYCHTESTPMTTGADLFIGSDPDSVRFQLLPDGRLQIDVTVKNQGNVASTIAYVNSSWENTAGSRTQIGSMSIPSLARDTQAVVSFTWMPPPTWTLGDGFFVFQLPPRLLLGQYIPVEIVRSINLTPTPTNLHVTNATPGEIYLAWDPPLNPPGYLAWDVYRDGVKITQSPIFSPSYTDFDLAPETPHVYKVVAIRIIDGLSSQPSDPVGGTTMMGAVFRVPQDFATIQAAINAAYSFASIHVAPGTYTEQLNLTGKHGLTIKGQDANGCILDYTGPMAVPINLGPTDGQPGNTLSGFTIRNGTIYMGTGDVVAGCVIKGGSPYPATAVYGSGLIAQCIIDTTAAPAVFSNYGEQIASVNSIHFSTTPIASYSPPPSQPLLLNNDFPNWTGYVTYQGSSGNFSLPPMFEIPGRPTEYIPAPTSPTVDRGLSLNPFFEVGPPDVGVFEAGQLYTPQPPAGLTATLMPGAPDRIRLTWTASIDDPGRMMYYLIYRSESPAFPPATAMNAYDMAPAGMTFFEDLNLAPGTTYYYQVRAFAGTSFPPADDELLSAPTNTASATTNNINNPPDAFEQSVTTTRNTPLVVTLFAWDLDGDALTYAVVSSPAQGSLSGIAPNLTYSPALDYTGPDSFSFTANDGQATSAPATVTITVNAPPVANAGADQTGNIGQVLTFSAAASYDPDGTIANNYIWIWGDNTAGSFSTATATHSYANPGTYTVALTGFDTPGPTAPDTLTVTINAPPVANAGADQTGLVGQVLSFSGAASTDSDGSIVSYSWNWGDGTAPGIGASATHAYTTAGSKTVTLTVTDNGGATATDTLTVTVNRENLALNKTATASTNYDSATTAAKAVDGATATFWRSAKVGSQYIRVDLGSAKSISNVMIYWPATYYAKTFKIETSTDGSKWTQRYAYSGGNGSVTNATFTAVSARHVRVTCTKPNSTSYGVAELEVYQ